MFTGEQYADRKFLYTTVFGEKRKFSSFLNYSCFLGDSSYILMKDGSVGVSLYVDLMDHESSSYDEVRSRFNSVDPIILPPADSDLQIMVINRLEAKLDEEESNPLSFIDSRKNSNAQNDTFSNYAIIFIRFKSDKLNLKNLLFSSLSKIKSEEELIKDVTYKVEAFRDSISFNSTLMSRSNVLDDFYYIINGKPSSTPLLTDGELDLSAKLTDHSYSFKNSSIICDDKKRTILSLHDISPLAYDSNDSGRPIHTSEPNLHLGAVYNAFQEIKNVEYVYCVNIESVNKEKKLGSITSFKGHFLRETESIDSRKQHLMAIKDAISDLDNDSVYLKVSCHLMINQGNDEKSNTIKVQRIFKENAKVALIKETQIIANTFYSTLPFHFEKFISATVSRSFLLKQEKVKSLIPWFKDFDGMKTKDLEFLNTQNQKVWFSLYNTQGVGHLVVLGDSGMGKSTTINAILRNILEKNKNSYLFEINKNATVGQCDEVYNIEINELDSDEMAFNPLRGVLTSARKNFICEFLFLAIHLNNPKFDRSSEHKELIIDGLNSLYEEEKRILLDQGEIESINDDVDLLLDLDSLITKIVACSHQKKDKKYPKLAAELKSKLKMFLSEGSENHFFKSEGKQSAKDKRHIVYDFKDLPEKSFLTPLLSFAIINEIETRINEIYESDKSCEGIIFIDELGTFGTNQIIINFIHEMSQRIRKKGFRFVFSAPKASVFFEKSSKEEQKTIGEVAIEMADQICIFKLNDDGINKLIEFSNSTNRRQKASNNKGFSVLNEAIIQMIENIQFKKYEFSEFVYYDFSKEVVGTYRNIPSPLEIWSASNGSEKLRNTFKKLLKKHKNNQKEALLEAVNSMPRGLK